jgi:hypothetical protein
LADKDASSGRQADKRVAGINVSDTRRGGAEYGERAMFRQIKSAVVTIAPFALLLVIAALIRGGVVLEMVR